MMSFVSGKKKKENAEDQYDFKLPLETFTYDRLQKKNKKK